MYKREYNETRAVKLCAPLLQFRLSNCSPKVATTTTATTTTTTTTMTTKRHQNRSSIYLFVCLFARSSVPVAVFCCAIWVLMREKLACVRYRSLVSKLKIKNSASSSH